MHKNRQALQIKVRSLKFPIQGRIKSRFQANAFQQSKHSMRVQEQPIFTENYEQLYNEAWQRQKNPSPLRVKPRSQQSFKRQILDSSDRIDLARSIELNLKKLSQQKSQAPKSFERFCTESYHNNVSKTLKWKNNRTVFSRSHKSPPATRKSQNVHQWKPQIPMPIHSRKTTDVLPNYSSAPKKSLFNSYRATVQANQSSILKKTQQQFKLLRKRIKYEQRRRYVVEKPENRNKNKTAQNQIKSGQYIEKQQKNQNLYRPWSGVKQKGTLFIN